jgi:hypothetical protein
MITKLYNGKVVIDFDSEKHIFWDKNSKRITGVTSVTSVIDKSRPLIFWAIGLMRDNLLQLKEKGLSISADQILEASKLHQVRKEEAADIGTKIHDWVEQWIKGKKPGAPEDPQVMNGINAFLKWVKETKIKLKCSETIVYSKKHDFVGIMDAEGEMDGADVIVDFKSSNAIYPEMLLQLSGYWLAREEEVGKKYTKGYIARFGKDTGDFDVIEILRKEHDKNIRAFLGALEIKKRLDQLKCQ